MAKTVNIGGDGSLFIGEDKVLRLEVLDRSGVPVNIATWATLLDVRQFDESATLIFPQVLGAVTGSYGSTRPTNSQRLLFSLSRTSHLAAALWEGIVRGRYTAVRTDTGLAQVLLRGDFIPERATYT